jgi:hypothetical protein
MKVRYIRENGELRVQVYEGNGWVNYTQSILYEPDTIGINTPGFRTFQKCVKAQYKIDPIYEV